jgi:hypothetical protein
VLIDGLAVWIVLRTDCLKCLDLVEELANARNFEASEPVAMAPLGPVSAAMAQDRRVTIEDSDDYLFCESGLVRVAMSFSAGLIFCAFDYGMEMPFHSFGKFCLVSQFDESDKSDISGVHLQGAP